MQLIQSTAPKRVLPDQGTNPYHVCIIFHTELSPDKQCYYKPRYIPKAFQTSVSLAEPVMLHWSCACFLFPIDTAIWWVPTYKYFALLFKWYHYTCISLRTLTEFHRIHSQVLTTLLLFTRDSTYTPRFQRVYMKLQLYPFQRLSHSTWKEVRDFIWSSQPYSQQEFASIYHKDLQI